MKTAIINCPDTGPLESLVTMLSAAGYWCHLPTQALLDELRPLGGLTLSNQDLQASMGYEPPFPIPFAGISAVRFCSLFVDIKAHQTYHNLVKRWPNLEGRVLWYRINGGKPEHVIKKKSNRPGMMMDGYEDCGDEVNPPCPVLTPNQWYKDKWWLSESKQPNGDGTYKILSSPQPVPWNAYTCWPPFVRFDEYYPKHSRAEVLRTPYTAPMCLIHNVEGWGYRDLLDPLRRLGLRVFGRGSPDGLIDHRVVPEYLSTTLAYVHLKSSDAPGYALYEALAAGCPVVCTRRLIWRCRMDDLLIPGETCLCFDRETHEGLTEDDVRSCTLDVGRHLECLRDVTLNQRIGMAGRRRLQQLMWNKEHDLPGLAEWLARNFPH